MKHKYLFLFSILFLFLSCNSHNKNNEISGTKDIKMLSIDPKHGTVTRYSQFMDSIRYIPLETTSSVILGGRIPKVIYVKNRYFIFDEKKVFVFDSHGKYIFHVGETGRGPREIIKPKDFLVDTKRKTVEILSFDGKIVRYDLYNGQFIDAIRVSGIAPDQFCKSDTDKYVLYGRDINSMEDKTGTVENLFFYNSTNKELKSTLAVPYYLTKFHGTPNNSFSTVEEGILFLRQLDNNIYLIDKTAQVRIRYKIDYGKYNIPLDEEFCMKYLEILEKTDYVEQFTGLLANDSYLYFHFYLHNIGYNVIYDRIHDILLYNQYKAFQNNIDFGPRIFPIGISDHCLIGAIEPAYFIKHFKKIRKNMGEEKWNKYLSGHPNIKNILNSVKPESNPILGLYYLKTKFPNENE